MPSFPPSHASTSFAGRRQITWASLQLSLGFAPMAGATAGLVLLVGTGVTRFSIGAVALTGAFSILSRALFHRRRLSLPGQPKSSSSS